MWEEEKPKQGHYRTFKKKNSMYILHFIHFANKELWIVVNENAFDVPESELKIMIPEEIFIKYGIKL